MTIWPLVTREILYRKLNSGLALLSVTVAVATLVGAFTILKAHDMRTRHLLGEKQAALKAQMMSLDDDIRRAMLSLGFNIVILPKDQNLSDWHAEDYAARCMPEDYVEKLASSDIMTITHLYPSLQQKIRWPEQNGRTIILVGMRGEVTGLKKPARGPLVQPVPEGAIVLGHELHSTLHPVAVATGQTVRLMGKDFTVHACHEQRGTKDDITAWISLGEAQELLGKPGQINVILALECMCAGVDPVARIRADISEVLPNTQVVEKGSEAIARSEARRKVAAEGKAAIERERRARDALKKERETLAAILVPVILFTCALWIAVLGFMNVRERRAEVGILRAMGFRSRQVLTMFITKLLVTGLIGGALGLCLGLFGGRLFGGVLEEGAVVDPSGGLLVPSMALLAMIVAPGLAVLSGWVPAVLAIRHDPAEVLREES